MAGERLPPPDDQDLRLARALSRWLDDRYLDPILGLLVPGLGDVAGWAVGISIVGAALRRRLSPVVIARMLVNVAIDALIGAVPMAGDAFDFVWKANKANLKLLETRPPTARKATAGDWLVVGGAAALALAALAAPLVLLVWAIGRFL